MASESAFRRPQPTRLQRRAPASIQTNNRSTQLNAGAIPLLSPVSSPTAPPPFDQIKDAQYHHLANSSAGIPHKPASVVYKKWQAAPFRYDSARSDGSRR